ncbi:MAG: 50S ribosomal protein L22 [Candidatus Micrarchaeota archaeon]|nr:50S ribosomal protein L22 [Candidatus Micrarchaeota archaeon]
MAYAYKPKENVKAAFARVSGVNASYKDLCNVCSNVRGWETEEAIAFLQKAAEGKVPILYRKFNHGKGHRKELGGRKGGWPVKSARIVLELVQNAHANASKLGLGATKIAHIMANKQHIYPRLSPKGRRIRQDYETAFVEVVLEEIQEKAAQPKRQQKEPKIKSNAAKQANEPQPKA